MRTYRWFRTMALLVLLTLSFHTVLVPAAGAVMVDSETLAGCESGTAARGRIVALLARAEVATALQQQGVTLAEAQARIASLTDREAERLAATLDTLPAGGDGFGSLIGAVLFIFLVLLITDIIGVTDVFPFVKKR